MPKKIQKNYIYIRSIYYIPGEPMQNIIKYIIIGIVVYFVLSTVFYIFKEWLKEVVVTWWRERREDKKKQRAEKERQLLIEKYANVKQGNPIMESIIKYYNIIVWGTLGAGKTLLANLIGKYLLDKIEKDDKKNARYNKYMRADYLKEKERLQKNNELPLSSNIKLKASDGRVAGDLWLYMTQQKKQIEKAIEIWDEIGTWAGKDLYYNSDLKNTWEVQKIDEHFRYKRQDAGVITIGTEQGRDNIFKPIRDKGFLEIQALRTYTYVTPKGKKIRSIKSFFNTILPAFITLDLKKIFQKCFDKTDKRRVLSRIWLPAYFLLPREYYLKKTKINSEIKEKYLEFKTIFAIAGNEHMFKFDKSDILNYDTEGHRKKYNEQFNDEGENKYVKKAS